MKIFYWLNSWEFWNFRSSVISRKVICSCKLVFSFEKSFMFLLHWMQLKNPFDLLFHWLWRNFKCGSHALNAATENFDNLCINSSVHVPCLLNECWKLFEKLKWSFFLKYSPPSTSCIVLSFRRLFHHFYGILFAEESCLYTRLFSRAS